VHAATIWNGSPITFTKPNDTDPTLAANQDRLTPNVWITRDSDRGIYNARTEEFYSDASPADTHWAYGTTADLPALVFKTWVDWHGGNPLRSIGSNAGAASDRRRHLCRYPLRLRAAVKWAVGFSYTRSTPAGGGPTTAPAIEYYHQEFDHYFVTRNADEIAKLDNGTFAGWRRTGLSFNVYATATAGAASVCRFFSTSFDPKSSHFYTPLPASARRCGRNPSWQFEGDGNEVFYIAVASAGRHVRRRDDPRLSGVQQWYGCRAESPLYHVYDRPRRDGRGRLGDRGQRAGIRLHVRAGLKNHDLPLPTLSTNAARPAFKDGGIGSGQLALRNE
jgi:hypothetical protein